ncbi:MAG TPA: tetratricopeptide repeat protein, partial [Blastocatellia bacterium]|nr:tetratricopeptide repeat protein [Blastocatellia bacterium]
LWGLAKLYKVQGNYAEAESLFKKAMGIFKKRLDPDDPRLGTWLMDYADLLRKTKRVNEAEKLEVRAAKIRAKTGPKKQQD